MKVFKSKLPVRGWKTHFEPAPVQTHGEHTPRRIILHSTESDGAGVRYGRDIVAFWQRQGLGYGAHFVVSSDGAVVNCAALDRITWHVENRNTGSIGIEQAGYAKFTHDQWVGAPAEYHEGRKIRDAIPGRPLELDATARIIAAVSHAWNIPLNIDAEHGLATHAMESADYGGSHTDPGPNYPLTHVLGMARAYVNAGGWRGEWHPLGA